VRMKAFIGPVALLVIWFAMTSIGLINPLFVPPPQAVGRTILTLSSGSPIYLDIASTVERLVLGFGIGASLGVILGIPVGYSEKLYRSIDPLIDFFRSVPVTALFPLFLLLFGIGDVAKVGIVAWSSSLIVIFNTIYGVKNSRKMRVLVAQTMKATRLQIFYKVVLPDSLPQIFVGLRTGLSLALIVVIVTEMFLGTTTGIGQRIFNTSITYRVPEMYASILIAGILGYSLNKCFALLERRLVHWSGK
jgi:ABC-type nitrate/sulfonate/bicarbonate transport system permease component